MSVSVGQGFRYPGCVFVVHTKSIVEYTKLKQFLYKRCASTVEFTNHIDFERFYVSFTDELDIVTYKLAHNTDITPCRMWPTNLTTVSVVRP